MLKVTIIVPVYNVEKYLARCLDTLISQTLSDIEIICVNDGSTDNSLNVLTQYQKFDSRIKIINKNNGGLSSARNAGIDAANGKYILFVDSDDWVSSIQAEHLYNNAEKNNSDVVIYDFVCNSFNDKKYTLLTVKDYWNKFVDTPFNIESIDSSSYKLLPVSSCLKLYRTDFINKNKIRFVEGMIFEDVPFWAEIYTKARRITYLPEVHYFYRINSVNSITKRNNRNYFDIIRAYSMVEDILKKAGYWEKYQIPFQCITAMEYMMKFFTIRQEDRHEFFDCLKNLPLNIDLSLYENDSFTDLEKRYLRCYSLLKNSGFEDFSINAAGVMNNGK